MLLSLVTRVTIDSDFGNCKEKKGIMAQEHDELEKLARKPEVFAPVDGPFEVISDKMVPGPYWAEVEERKEELAQDPVQLKKEEEGLDKKFPVNRRNFLRFMGLGVAASAASCVRRPAERAVAYVDQPVDHATGVPTYYATTCQMCPSSCGLLVKTLEGRVTKVEGHSAHPATQGSSCSLAQAQVQALYHPERLKSPQKRNQAGELKDVRWSQVFKELSAHVQDTKKVAIFTGASTGHRDKFFRDFLSKLDAPQSNLFTWDSNSLIAALQEAHEIAFQSSGMPRVELGKARFLVGVGSDFQDVGVSTLYQTKGFSRFHTYRYGKKNEFVQFESHMTITGGKADTRHVIPPGYELSVVLLLLNKVFSKKASRLSPSLRKLVASILKDQRSKLTEAAVEVGVSTKELSRIADKLVKEASVVLAGSTAHEKNGTLLQLATLLLNKVIGAYDKNILEFEKGWLTQAYHSDDLKRFEKAAKDIDVLFIVDSNPAFTLPQSWKFKELLKKVKTVVSVQSFPCETDESAHYALPSHNFLEAWGDAEPVSGFLSVQQPTMRATTNSRQAEDILLWVLAAAKKSLPYSSYRAYLKEKWKGLSALKEGKLAPFENKYKKLLATGFTGKLKERKVSSIRNVRLYFQEYELPQSGPKLLAPLDSRFLDGRGAHLPVLQEIGDAMTTIAWDSWVSLSPEKMKSLGLRKNQKVRLEASGQSLDLAAYPMPGLHKDAVVVYRGNGHTDKRSTISFQNGENPLSLFSKKVDGLSHQPVTGGESVRLKPLDEFYRLAAMQKQSDLMNRKDIIKEYSLAEASTLVNNQELDKVPDLYPKLKGSAHSPYRWGMAIDLDKCNGCGACMTACSIENNIPQVGREQILLGRKMHWIRRDRYFSGKVDNPKVTFQPVMCQHCNHAPCEPVCPVFATTHEPEGLNAMTYNRCVGTRYCANACPYKVRRFNYFTYQWREFGKEEYNRNPVAANPNVTVRTRGVMEKCSLCVGRIRDGKHAAKREGRTVRDGEVKTACQQTCPTGAIVFGNLNDSHSRISKLRRNGRAYLLLGADPKHKHYGLKTLPNINYLAKINLKGAPASKAHHVTNHEGHPEKAHGNDESQGHDAGHHG